MICGLLLVYIGYKMQFPLIYMIAAWFVTFVGGARAFTQFFKGVYDAGVEDGESKTN